jgi:GntR family transcriptional regulator, rspAB operon transcriptional repressor
MARTRPHLPEIPAMWQFAPGSATTGAEGANQRGQIGRHAYEALRTAILDCTLLPGMAISEQAISDSMCISRAPVREAFRQLAAEGLLESAPQKGSFVALLSPAKITDAIFVREMIECRAAELAALAPLAQRKTLEKILKVQKNASAKKDYATHLASDETFHHQILCLAGHPHAWPALRQARTGMNRIRHLAIPQLGSNQIAIDHHRVIVDAILAGDGLAASHAMRTHIQSPRQFLQAILASSPQYFALD